MDDVVPGALVVWSFFDPSFSNSEGTASVCFLAFPGGPIQVCLQVLEFSGDFWFGSCGGFGGLGSCGGCGFSGVLCIRFLFDSWSLSGEGWFRRQRINIWILWICGVSLGVVIIRHVKFYRSIHVPVMESVIFHEFFSHCLEMRVSRLQ